MKEVNIMCEILVFLKDNPDSTTREIVENIKGHKGTILECLNTLNKKELVLVKWKEGEVPYIDMPTWRVK